MEEKLEYERFMILLSLRRVIPEWKRLLKESPSQNTYIKDYYNQAIEFGKLLYGIDVEKDNYEAEIDKLILQTWPKILNGLGLGIYDYNWTLSSFRYTISDEEDYSDTKLLYKIYQSLNTKFNYYGFPVISYETNPIYFEIYNLKYINAIYVELFEDVIERGLYDPNKRNIDGSHHPFWTMQNSIDSKSSLCRKVILDSRTNYQMDSNGSSIPDYLAYRIRFFKNPEEVESSISLLEPMIIENNCSVIEDYYEDTCFAGYVSKRPLIYHLFGDKSKINEIAGLGRIYTYCLSEEGVRRQIEASTHPSTVRDEAINFYLSLLEKDNPSNEKGKQLLKKIKL